MQFSTQCPHCSTAFVITVEQIRVASGLVRCGVCPSIFEADRHLFGVEEGSDTQLQTMGAAAHAPTGMHLAEAGTAVDPSLELETPSFTRHGKGRKSASRVSWGRWMAVLTATLVFQLVWVSRNQLYAAAPEWMAHFESICHCQLGWPRQLHSIEVAQSTFQITPSASHVLQLSLKNQAHSTVATPDLMLTLIDATEGAVVRKYFPHQHLQLPSQLSGGESYPIDLRFQVPPRLAEQIVGFRAELFYP